MKYIRTGLFGQGKIYSVEKAKKYQDMFVLRNNGLIQPISCCNLNEIGRVADTIEELCDEFVCKRPSGETYILDKPFNLKAQQEYIGDTYGAIWSEWGLKYVAKMNEKGELELI